MFSYPLLFAQSVVSYVFIIMVNFIFVTSLQKLLFSAAEIDFMEQNHVRTLDPSLMKLRLHWLHLRKRRYYLEDRKYTTRFKFILGNFATLKAVTGLWLRRVLLIYSLISLRSAFNSIQVQSNS